MAKRKLITILAGAVVSFPVFGTTQDGLIRMVGRSALAASPEQAVAHTVQHGENLWRIALDHGFTEQELMDYNRLPNSVIRPGQVIRMPGKGSSGSRAISAPAEESVPGAAGVSGSYTVKGGDVLSAIAKSHGVTTQALMTANGIEDATKLRIGQALKIPGGGSGSVVSRAADTPVAPATPVAAATHTVRKGDTLFQIAGMHKVSIAQIKAANNLATEQLRIGQSLVIPGASVARTGEVVPVNAPISSPPRVSDYGNYTVQKGDTFSKIARDFGTTSGELIRVNQITNPNVLIPGQNLLVPGGVAVSNATPAAPAAVGDGNLLAQGPELGAPEVPQLAPVEQAPPLLPDPLPVRSGGVQDYAGYTIVPGDTLDTIAQTFATTKAELMRLNKLSSPDEVKSGDQILVPTYGIYNELGGPY